MPGGVAALHREGIVHSDLKPSNIMLKRIGSTKIIDIGSAFDLYDSPPIGRCTPAVRSSGSARRAARLAPVGPGEPGIRAAGDADRRSTLRGKHRIRAMLRAKKNILERLPRLLPTEEIAYSELLDQTHPPAG